MARGCLDGSQQIAEEEGQEDGSKQKQRRVHYLNYWVERQPPDVRSDKAPSQTVGSHNQIIQRKEALGTPVRLIYLALRCLVKAQDKGKGEI